MTEEQLFTLFQRDAIDDALALYTFQACRNHIPLATVNHDGHAGNVGLGGNQVQEMRHLSLGIEQAVIHIDVNDQRPVFHLFAGYLQSLLIVLLLDESQELA